MKKVIVAFLLCLVSAANAGAQVIFAEDFETTAGLALPAGWNQSVNTVGPDYLNGWNSGDNHILGSINFKMSPHTRFLAVNDDRSTGSDNTNSFLVMPPVDLSAITNPFLSFSCCFLNMTFAGYSERATIEVSVDSGATWREVETLAATTPGWWRSKTINLAAFAGRPSVYIGFRYSDNAGWAYGIGIDDIKVFMPPREDISITAIEPTSGSYKNYGLAGGAVPLKVSVTNNGGNYIGEFAVGYQFAGGSIVTTTIVPVTIAPFTTQTFTLPDPVILPGAPGDYPLRVWVAEAGDTNHANDTAASCILTVVPFMPLKKPLIEEATGVWCGWCVRGKVYMDSLQTLWGGGVSRVAVHNIDPMQVTPYDSWFSLRIGDYPNVWIDRRIMDDPINFAAANTDFTAAFGFADINATGSLAPDGSLTIYTEVRPAVEINHAALAFIVTEDSVTGISADWNQANNYSYRTRNIPFTGGGFDYNAATDPIVATQMQYNHVARIISPTVKGVTGLLPPAMNVGDTYYASHTLTLEPRWNKSKIHVIAALIDSVTGNVLNTQNFDLQPIAAGIAKEQNTTGGIVLYPNPASEKAVLVFNAFQPGNATVACYNMLGQAMMQKTIDAAATGNNAIELPVTCWPAGIYTIWLQTAAGVTTRLLQVQH